MSYTHVEDNMGASSLHLLNTEGLDVAKIITLDSYILENKIPKVDFIKMDVEGAELDILRGATTVIARWKPILAISAYHKWNDFWVLMNFIKSIRDDYEFALRQYPWTREDEGFMFKDGQEEFWTSLGIEGYVDRHYNECVLLAR